MAVRLRLRRMGRKKRPFYRIVAADSRSPRNGRFIEELGYYNPLTDPMTIVVKEDRAMYWLQQGAIPSDTVKSLLKSKGIILRLHLMERGMDETKIEEELKKWEVLQIEKLKRLAEKKAFDKEKAKSKRKEKQEQEKKESAEAAPAPAEASKAVEEAAPKPVAGKEEEAKEEAPAETSEPAATTEETPKETAEEKPEGKEEKKEEEAKKATEKVEDAGDEEKKEMIEETNDTEQKTSNDETDEDEKKDE